METANRSVRGDSISSVDKTADNQSNVGNTATTAAANTVSGSPDAGRAVVQASQSTGSMGGIAIDPSLRPHLASVGRPRRSLRRPARFLDSVAASLPPIGRCVARYRIVSHMGCRLVFARMRSQPVEPTRTCPDVSVAVSTVNMPKKCNAM